MLSTGLASVTLRSLPCEAVIKAAVDAELQGIEWGGDVHVVPGDVSWAHRVGGLTRDAGLRVVSYGSYYKVGTPVRESCAWHRLVPQFGRHLLTNPTFDAVLDAARGMGAPTIRVWAGACGSDKSTEDLRARVVDDARHIAHLAAKEDVRIGFEYHSGTLTDSADSAERLMREIDRDNVTCYWQPPMRISQDQRIEGLTQILPWLSNVHAHPMRLRPQPLADVQTEWETFLTSIAAAEGDRCVVLEFVKGASVDQVKLDAVVLNQLVRVV